MLKIPNFNTKPIMFNYIINNKNLLIFSHLRIYKIVE